MNANHPYTPPHTQPLHSPAAPNDAAPADAPHAGPPAPHVDPTATAARPATAVLLASAAALAGALVYLLAPAPRAQADVLGEAGALTALTVSAGPEDLLLVLDRGSEELMVYRVQNQSSIELFEKYSVPRLFAEARGRVRGTAEPAQTTPGPLAPGAR